MVWSGWEGDGDGEQRIYLAHLKNPWTIDSNRVLLSYPQYPWKRVGDLLNRPAMPRVNVNEGPEILKRADDIFLLYSGSACWTDYYELGVMRAKSGANLMDPASWTKYDHVFFKQNREAGSSGRDTTGSSSLLTASRTGSSITRMRSPSRDAGSSVRRGFSPSGGMEMGRQTSASLSRRRRRFPSLRDNRPFPRAE